MFVYDELSLRDRIPLQATDSIQHKLIVINPPLSQAPRKSYRASNTNYEVSFKQTRSRKHNKHPVAIMWLQDNTFLCDTCQCNNIEIVGMGSVAAPTY
jgi:hypothetical protein